MQCVLAAVHHIPLSTPLPTHHSVGHSIAHCGTYPHCSTRPSTLLPPLQHSSQHTAAKPLSQQFGASDLPSDSLVGITVQRSSDETLVVMLLSLVFTVSIRRVDQTHTSVHRTMQHRNGIGFRWTIVVGKWPGACRSQCHTTSAVLLSVPVVSISCGVSVTVPPPTLLSVSVSAVSVGCTLGVSVCTSDQVQCGCECPVTLTPTFARTQ